MSGDIKGCEGKKTGGAILKDINLQIFVKKKFSGIILGEKMGGEGREEGEAAAATPLLQTINVSDNQV